MRRVADESPPRPPIRIPLAGQATRGHGAGGRHAGRGHRDRHRDLSLLNSALWRPLPSCFAARTVAIIASPSDWPGNLTSETVEALRHNTRSFSRVSAYYDVDMRLDLRDRVESLHRHRRRHGVLRHSWRDARAGPPAHRAGHRGGQTVRGDQPPAVARPPGRRSRRHRALARIESRALYRGRRNAAADQLRRPGWNRRLGTSAGAARHGPRFLRLRLAASPGCRWPRPAPRPGRQATGW